MRCRVLYLRAGFLRRHDVRFHLGSVRRRANSAHEPTHRRLCIKCPTLCAATYFFTAFSPYTSLSVILLVVLCRRHFWFGLRSFILRSFVLFSPTISRGPVSFFFSFFCARPFAWLLKQCALGRISLCRKRMLPCSLSQYERGSLVRCWLISLALRGRHCVRYLLHSVARCLCCPGRVYISFVCGQRSRRLCPLWRAVSKNV